VFCSDVVFAQQYMYMLRQQLARPEQKAGFGVLPHYSTYTYTVVHEAIFNIDHKKLFLLLIQLLIIIYKNL